jgi:2-polyprenyl-3-methyl-5-hydroxy-6-metoxy-1,4-benzoquinol methylase
MSDITIGVALITRNRIEQLRRLLPQLTKMDQVVVCDTGSQDGTEAYVRKLGKPFQYIKFPWRDHPTKSKPEWGFNAARNESFKHLKTTHAVWLDTDDVVGQVKGNKEVFASADQVYGVFKKIAIEAPPQIDVWFIKYVYSRDENGNPNVVHTRERMVKLSSGWKWVYPIHECLVPNQKPEHAIVTDLDVIHLPGKIVQNSSERNMKMLRTWYEQLKDQGNHHDLSRCRLNIGETLFSLGEDKACADWLVGEFLKNHPEALDIEKWHAWVYVAKAQMGLNNYDAGKAAALAAIDLEPGLPDGYLLLAQIKLVTKGDPQDTLLLIDDAARKDDPPSQMITNPLDYTFTPYCIVSDCKFQLGQYDAALEWAQKAQAIAPADPRAEFLRAQASAAVRRRDAINSAKALYQLYLDYDENEKAARMYEFLPYVAQQNTDVIEMAKIANKRVRHIFDRKEYVKLYENNTGWFPAKDEWIEQDNPPGRDRFEWVLSRLKKALPNGGRVLDVGCSDGFHSLLYAKHGYQVVGVDIDQRCVDVANERAKRWNLPAIFVKGYFEEMETSRIPLPMDPTRNWQHEFDAVVCCEVLEHVPDPAFLLGCLGDCAKDNAPILITTPDEAFDKGDTPEGGGAYLQADEITAHVRIFTQESFEALLKSDSEFHVIESHFIPFIGGYREGQGWQGGEIRRMPRPEGPIIRVYCGEAVSFSPDMINTGGIGGSETAVINMAKAWAAMGCQVIVYSGVNGIYDGVFYRTADFFNPDKHSDVFIAWRWPLVFSRGRPNADTTILWMHDLFSQLQVPGYQPNEIPKSWADNIDYVMVLSEFHKQCVENVHATLRGKIQITRNGIDPARYINRNIDKVSHKYFYSSSYDRGLEQLLEIWPQIQEAIPDAELHVAYGVQTSEMIYQMTGEKDKLNQIYRLLGKMKSLPGVVHHERLGQQELADLQLSCEAWLYPYQDNEFGGFLETYCITALEAMAARCVPIARRNGALKEIVQHGHTWNEKMTIEHLLEILKDEKLKFPDGALDENQKYALSRSWDSLAVAWAENLQPKEAVAV